MQIRGQSSINDGEHMKWYASCLFVLTHMWVMAFAEWTQQASERGRSEGQGEEAVNTFIAQLSQSIMKVVTLGLSAMMERTMLLGSIWVPAAMVSGSVPSASELET